MSRRKAITKIMYRTEFDRGAVWNKSAVTSQNPRQPRSSFGGVRLLSTFCTRTNSPHTTYRYSDV
ncbi:hypothetical protein SAMN06272765_2586 [Streptomyces sp. Ag109_G2-15]|nr:hypothetical protein SAMN06272765_2586 [Streptomyces sp. Ag109_G2-15]